MSRTPTWSGCRQAARGVLAAEHGRAAVDRFRPRSVSGLVRSRPPLAVLLWLAARRDLLVWKSAEEFLVLDPPRGGPLAGTRARSRLDAVDRWWDVLVFAVPPFAALLLAAAAGLTGTTAGLVTALVLVVLGLGFVTVMMLGTVVRGAVELFRTVEHPPDSHVGVALESVLFTHWSLAVVHCPGAGPEQLAGLLDGAGGLVGPGPGPEDGTGLLLYVAAAVTTDRARAGLEELVRARRWRRTSGPLVVRMDDRRRVPRPASAAAGSGSGISLLLLATAVWLLVAARFVASAERAACRTTGCADAPATYGSALLWLSGRVLPFAAPGRLTATTHQAELLGRGSTALGYVLLACVVIALGRAAAAHRAYLEALHEELIKVASRRPTIGLVTALPEEFFAVRALLEDAVDVGVHGDRSRYVVGTLPSAGPGEQHVVVLVQATLTGTRSMATACTTLSTSFPSVTLVVLTGIAAGVPRPDRPDRHVRLGDVVVSTWGIADYDHVTVYADGTVPRREFPRPSPQLTRAADRLAADELGGSRPWERWLDPTGRSDLVAFARPPADTDVRWDEGPPARPVPHPDPRRSGHRVGWPKVVRGRVGSGDKALNDAGARDAYARRYDLAALEMEGAGLGDAAFLQGLEWMVVRGISDYGDRRRGDLWKPYAALAAAAYTRALLAATPPVGPRGSTPWPDRAGTGSRQT